jgi:tRNA pseudouridine55 synthase
VRLDAEGAGRFLSGVRRRLPLADAPKVRVYGPDPQACPGDPERSVFLGGGHITAGELISTRLLSPVEVQGLLQYPKENESKP